MQIPTEITFHNLDHSEAAEACVLRWIARLEQLTDRIEKCTVVLGQPHRHHRHGRAFQLSVVLEIPGPNIAVSHVGHENIYVAIADAFRVARRQLLDQFELQRGFVKTHVVERTGNVGVNVAKHRADTGTPG